MIHSRHDSDRHRPRKSADSAATPQWASRDTNTTMASPFTIAWAEWVAEGLSEEECHRRATNMQIEAIQLYESECKRLFAADPLQEEFYERSWNQCIAGNLKGWPALVGLPPERRRWLRINADYLYGLYLRTGGW